MALATSSSISLPASTRSFGSPSSSSSCGSNTSSPATLPRMRSRSGSMMSSPSLSAAISRPEDRAAVLLGDRDVLRHVHQAAGQVAGVGRLERRVGQALPGAVGRDEVLEHREPLTEVRLDRALDDLADAAGELLLRLGHQAAHAGELPDLVAAAAEPESNIMNTGLNPPRRDPHRVDHRLGHVVVGVGPGVDHLVVPLAEGDLAGVVRPLEPLDPRRRPRSGARPSRSGSPGPRCRSRRRPWWRSGSRTP